MKTRKVAICVALMLTALSSVAESYKYGNDNASSGDYAEFQRRVAQALANGGVTSSVVSNGVVIETTAVMIDGMISTYTKSTYPDGRIKFASSIARATTPTPGGTGTSGPSGTSGTPVVIPGTKPADTTKPGTSPNTKGVLISSTSGIQGCNSGLIVLNNGAYRCKSVTYVADGGTVANPTVGPNPTKVITPPGDNTASAGPGLTERANNSRGYSGGMQAGWRGADGQLYSGPDEATATTCSGCVEVNTTYQKDTKDQRDRDFEAAAKATAEKERDSRDRDPSGSHGGDSTRDSGSQTDRASGS